MTGGGVYHGFLKRLMVPNVWVQADDTLIEGKEAMAFAFLGLLKLRGEDNVLSSVTGVLKIIVVEVYILKNCKLR